MKYKDRVRRQASCDGKQPLTKAIADRITKQSNHAVMPYRCKFCGSWHVGSSTGKVKDDRRSDR